jgi:hypothetical protein
MKFGFFSSNKSGLTATFGNFRQYHISMRVLGKLKIASLIDKGTILVLCL